MFRDVILIRPPCEANSLLIGVTEGCSWNRCRFCGIYHGIQDYRVRPWESIKRDIDTGMTLRGGQVKTVFLAGGNAFSAPTPLLERILEYLDEKIPGIERVSAYAKNHDILAKTPDELYRLGHTGPGVSILYMGLESGSDAVLRYMRKGTTARAMVRAAKRLKPSGIKLSVYVILGLGGKQFTDHPIETARVLSEMRPDVIRFRSMNFIPGSDLYEDWKAGRFTALRPVETINEELTILENLDPDLETTVLNDHVSNYTAVHGKLPRERERIIYQLKLLLRDPWLQRLPHVNRTSM